MTAAVTLDCTFVANELALEMHMICVNAMLLVHAKCALSLPL
jgi:hypothetical protein